MQTQLLLNLLFSFLLSQSPLCFLIELSCQFFLMCSSLLFCSHLILEKKKPKLSKHANHDQYEINVVKNSKLTRVLSVSNAAREPLPNRSSASSFSSSSSSSSSFYGEKVIIRNFGVLLFSQYFISSLFPKFLYHTFILFLPLEKSLHSLLSSSRKWEQWLDHPRINRRSQISLRTLKGNTFTS